MQGFFKKTLHVVRSWHFRSLICDWNCNMGSIYRWNFTCSFRLKRTGLRCARNKSTQTCTPSRSHLLLLIPLWNNSRAHPKANENDNDRSVAPPWKLMGKLDSFGLLHLEVPRFAKDLNSVIFVKQGQLTPHVRSKNYSYTLNYWIS